MKQGIGIRFTRAILAAMALAFVSAQDIRAEDIDPAFIPMPRDWTGLYVGVHGGWGLSDKDVKLDSFSPGLAGPVAAGVISNKLDTGSSGFIGGAQVGISKQLLYRFVFGAEADISFSDVNGKEAINTAVVGFVPTTTTASTGMDWFGTLRARAGIVPTPKLLLYATGGLAFADMKYKTSIVGTPGVAGNFYGSRNKTKVGWTVGGGAEWKIGCNCNWSVRAEYLFYDLGKQRVTSTDTTRPGSFFNHDFNSKGHIVRAALNYRFWTLP